MTNIIIGNIVGAIGLFMSLYALKQQDIAKLKRYTAYCSILLSISYYFLGGITAAIIILIIAVRQFIGSVTEKLNKNYVLLLCIFFVLLAIGCTYYTWKDYMSLFPGIATVISTIAYFYSSQKQLRIVLIISTVLWLIYAVHIYSLFHLIGCVMGILVGLQELKKMKEE